MARSSKVAEANIADSSSTPKLRVEYWPIERLKRYEKNPRKNDGVVDRIVDSITAYGFCVPILAKSTGDVIDGDLRLKGAHRLKMTEVPVIPCDLWTEAQVKAFRLMVNRSVSWADWDLDALRLEFAELTALEFDLTLTGFDSREIDSLTLPINPAEDEVPSLPETPVTRPGDLWLLGSSDMRQHRVYCGDATKPEDVARLMDGRKADLVVVDFPYNVDYKGKTKDSLTIQNDNMSDAEFYSFLLATYRHLLEHTKPGRGIYVFHADTEGVNFRRGMVDAGWKLAQCCVWIKNSMVMGRQDYHCQHEPVLYGWKPGAAHRWLADRTQTTVWNFDRPTRSTEHPTIKPVALLSYAITNSSERGEIVLDTFLGSGSTLCASEQIGRICYGSEIDQKYVDVAVLRWQSFTGKQATLGGDGRTFAEVKAERFLIQLGAQAAIKKEGSEVLV